MEFFFLVGQNPMVRGMGNEKIFQDESTTPKAQLLDCHLRIAVTFLESQYIHPGKLT